MKATLVSPGLTTTAEGTTAKPLDDCRLMVTGEGAGPLSETVPDTLAPPTTLEGFKTELSRTAGEHVIDLGEAPRDVPVPCALERGRGAGHR